MTDIERTEVESSNLHSVGYDADTQTLAVQFWDGNDPNTRIPGHMYHYFEVPAHIHQAMMKAESVGKYFYANVRNGFTTEKVT